MIETNQRKLCKLWGGENKHQREWRWEYGCSHCCWRGRFVISYREQLGDKLVGLVAIFERRELLMQQLFQRHVCGAPRVVRQR